LVFCSLFPDQGSKLKIFFSPFRGPGGKTEGNFVCGLLFGVEKSGPDVSGVGFLFTVFRSKFKIYFSPFTRGAGGKTEGEVVCGLLFVVWGSIKWKVVYG